MDAPSRALKIRELGHVALFVRDLAATRRFYRDVLGLAETGTGKDGRIVFFSAGVHHHDVSCELARAAGSRRTGSRRSARRTPRSRSATPTATRSSSTSIERRDSIGGGEHA